jgi:rSAM/selenodomain-associated transferase 2
VRLSIVIPALNEAAHIERAVRSAWHAGADEVIVVDGGSSDATPTVAAALDCRLLHSSRGRAIQQNAGARVATGEVLLFLHADNFLEDCDAGRHIAHVTASGRRIHGACQQRIEASGIGYRLLERGNAARVRLLGLPYGDQAIFVRRDVFQQVGGFPNVPILEDLILMQLLRKQAWPALLPVKVVVSPRRWQSQGIARQTLRNWWLVARHWLGATPQSLAGHYAVQGSPDLPG